MILYEGPSLLDPAVDIVVVATEDSNPKTGKMLYTWILRADRAPEVAAYDGSDDAICGDCKFRAFVGVGPPDYPTQGYGSRTCYVRLSPAEGADEALPPSEVWRKWKAGHWDFGGAGRDQLNWDWIPDRCAGPYGQWQYVGDLPVRIGSYGDPAAVPTRVWAELVRYRRHWTGYTHMWKPKTCSKCWGSGETDGPINQRQTCPFCNGSETVDRCDPDLKRYCMASVDTPEERAEAQALGWRTFMVVPEREKLNYDDQLASVRMNAVGPIPKSPWGRDILCPATDPHPRRGKVCVECHGDGFISGWHSGDADPPCSKCNGAGRVNTTCSTCLLCRGTSAPAPSIWEVAHGKNKGDHQW